jgi:hypothetical protein
MIKNYEYIYIYTCIKEQTNIFTRSQMNTCTKKIHKICKTYNYYFYEFLNYLTQFIYEHT